MIYPDNIREAAQEWVSTFNEIPLRVFVKLRKTDGLQEVTPPGTSDRVVICSGRHKGKHGTVLGVSATDKDSFVIEIDGASKAVSIKQKDFEVEYHDTITTYDTLWAFSSSLDNRWIEEQGGLQIMADCGFRIYKQSDYGYIFGIDGVGYDFYKEHWIPLYKARGLTDMFENEKCCPICQQDFIPDDGVTAVEHLAKGVMTVIREMQNKMEYSGVNTMLPCPRCGIYRMHIKAVRNSLSRHETVHICSICGTDEAVRVYSNCVLPTADWWIVKEILAYKKD